MAFRTTNLLRAFLAIITRYLSVQRHTNSSLSFLYFYIWGWNQQSPFLKILCEPYEGLVLHISSWLIKKTKLQVKRDKCTKTINTRDNIFCNVRRAMTLTRSWDSLRKMVCIKSKKYSEECWSILLHSVESFAFPLNWVLIIDSAVVAIATSLRAMFNELVHRPNPYFKKQVRTSGAMFAVTTAAGCTLERTTKWTAGGFQPRPAADVH